MHAVQSVCAVGHRVIVSGGHIPRDVEKFITVAIFATVTNVNFVPEDFVDVSFCFKKS